MSKSIYLVSEIARLLNVAPRILSDLFYQRRLDDARCTIVGGRRLIPADYLPEIKAVLLEAGKIKKRRNDAARKNIE